MQCVLHIINSTICKSVQNLFLFSSIFSNNSLLRNDGKLLQKLMKIMNEDRQ